MLISKIFILITTILSLSACANQKSNHKDKPKYEVRKGIINSILITSTIDTVFKAYYIKGLTGNPIFLRKNDTISIKSDHLIFFMDANLDQTNYILYPGDTITIHHDNHHNIKFTASNKARNDELNFFPQLIESLGSIRYLGRLTYLNGNLSLRKRDSLITAMYYKRREFLNDYAEKHKIRNSFKHYCLLTFEYSMLYEKLALYYKGYNKSKLHSFYCDSLASFRQILSNTPRIENIIWKDALNQLARYYINNDRNIPWVSLSGLSNAQLTKMYDSVELNFPNELKRYELGDILLNIIYNDTPLEANHSILKKQIASISNEEYKSQLTNALTQKLSKVNIKDILEQKLIRLDSSEITWGTIKKKYKGNLLIIDYWASWCIPCISELPYAKKLKDEFKDKPLKFIYFSFDQNYSWWKQASYKHELDDNNSFLVEGAFDSFYAMKMRINSIPRYIIINQQGKIINVDAPRPSNPKLKRLLNELLNK